MQGLAFQNLECLNLRKTLKELTKSVKGKDEQRNLSLNLDTGTNETISAVQKVKEKIAQNSSAFGKLVGGVVDRRGK